MSEDPIGGSSVGQSSKRPAREQEVDSRPSKKIAESLEDCVRDISDTVRALKQAPPRVILEQEQMDSVLQILEEGGIHEGSDVHCDALILC
jgi:hypothetical protein